MSTTTPMYTLLLASVAIFAGILVPFQAGSNAMLGRGLGHPLWATVASLVVSLMLILPVIFAMRIAVPKFTEALEVPLWAWLGGLAGVIFITAALMLTPRLGTTGFVACVIAGQMVAALIIDHYGLLGLTIREANPGRLVGVLAIFAGVIIIQRYTPAVTLTP